MEENWRWMNEHYGFNFIGEKIKEKVDLFYKMPNYLKFLLIKKNKIFFFLIKFSFFKDIKTNWW